MQAERLIQQLRKAEKTIATAESCSGGMLAAALTDVPGASAAFGYGVVTYANEAKIKLLGVPEAILSAHGAVSEETARAMAEGLHKLSQADLALVTTGIAGPEGGSAEKPVGLVYIGCGNQDGTMVRRCLFSGDRAAVRQQTVAAALALAEEILVAEESI